MDSTTKRRGVDVAWCLLTFAALWTLTRMLPGVDPVVPAVAAIAAAIFLLALADGPESPVILGIPVLMIVLVVPEGESARLLSSGMTLAACLATAGWRWVEAGRISVPRGALLLCAALAPAQSLPFAGSGIAPVLVSGLGALAIVVASSDEGRVGIDVVMLAFCIALAAPAIPLRASLFPFVVAALILLLRGAGPFRAGLFVLLVLAAGKWYLPLLLAAAAGFAAHRYRVVRSATGTTSQAIAVPFLSGIPVAPLCAAAVVPDAWVKARRAGLAASVTAALLGAGSLFVQPSLASIYVLTGAVCLLALGRADDWSTTLLSFVLAMVGLTAWSGAVSGAFPLPAAPVVVVLLGLAGFAAALAVARAETGLAAGGSAMFAGLAVAVVLLHPSLEPRGDVVASGLRIVAGDTVSLPLPEGTKRLRLQVAGGNVAGLVGGTVVGIARVEPSGEAHDIRIGEIADWGAKRREHYLTADNPYTLEPAGPMLGRGRDAFLSGAGVVRLRTDGGSRLTIEALPALGEAGLLLVDSVEAVP